jgi:predicted transcriptional regulator
MYHVSGVEMHALREIHLRILSVISQHMPLGAQPSQIVKEAPIPPPASAQKLNQYLNALLKKGLVEKRRESMMVYYTITALGINTFAKNSSFGKPEPSKVFTPSAEAPESNATQPSQEKVFTTRAHKFGLAYPLKDPLSPDEPPHLFALSGIPPQSIALNNNSQAQIAVGNITARLTTKQLELFTSDLYTDNRTLSIEVESALKRKFDALALNLEAKLQKVANFKLIRIDKDTLSSPIISQHWAEEHHPLAEASPESPLVLAYSPIDGKPRFGIDQSEGFREAETYHSRTADMDKDTLDKQFNAILDGKINLLDMDYYLNRLAQSQANSAEETAKLATAALTTQNQLNYYSAQIEAHAKAIVKLNKVLDKLDRLLSQRKLNEFKG